MALTATAIVSNAMFLQNGRHPEPLFMTRPAGRRAGAEAAPPAPCRSPRTPRRSVAIADAAAAPRPLPAPPAAAPRRPDAAIRPSSDVADVQRELARLGLYSGAIDGVAGARTEAAIAAFETAAGLAGHRRCRRAELLDRAEAAVAARNADRCRRDAAAAAQAAELDRRERERAETIAERATGRGRAAGASTTASSRPRSTASATGRSPSTASPAPTTADAIRRFELDNGLPITGEASDASSRGWSRSAPCKPG